MKDVELNRENSKKPDDVGWSFGSNGDRPTTKKSVAGGRVRPQEKGQNILGSQHHLRMTQERRGRRKSGKKKLAIICWPHPFIKVTLKNNVQHDYYPIIQTSQLI